MSADEDRNGWLWMIAMCLLVCTFALMATCRNVSDVAYELRRSREVSR